MPDPRGRILAAAFPSVERGGRQAVDHGFLHAVSGTDRGLPQSERT
jgi:hypothetical protein